MKNANKELMDLVFNTRWECEGKDCTDTWVLTCSNTDASDEIQNIFNNQYDGRGCVTIGYNVVLYSTGEIQFWSDDGEDSTVNMMLFIGAYGLNVTFYLDVVEYKEFDYLFSNYKRNVQYMASFMKKYGGTF
jgi:hypothetical protein